MRLGYHPLPIWKPLDWSCHPPSISLTLDFQLRTSFSLKGQLTANTKDEYPELPSGWAEAVFLGSFLHEAVCLTPK